MIRDECTAITRTRRWGGHRTTGLRALPALSPQRATSCRSARAGLRRLATA
jgi:hypothetical protein